MIRQVKPPALFSVDLSNVPAASCSIIMVSSPLLLHRQCLSSLSLSPSLLLLFSSYCFLFFLSPLHRILHWRDPCLPVLLSQSEFLSLSLCLLHPTSLSSSVVRGGFFLSRLGLVTRITRIASKTANNKCFSAPPVVKFVPR